MKKPAAVEPGVVRLLHRALPLLLQLPLEVCLLPVAVALHARGLAHAPARTQKRGVTAKVTVDVSASCAALPQHHSVPVVAAVLDARVAKPSVPSRVQQPHLDFGFWG
jgi:hypothetical protein